MAATPASKSNSISTCQGVHVIAKVMAFIGREKKLDGLNQRPVDVSFILQCSQNCSAPPPPHSKIRFVAATVVVGDMTSKYILQSEHGTLFTNFRKVPELRRPPPPNKKKKALVFKHRVYVRRVDYLEKEKFPPSGIAIF